MIVYPVVERFISINGEGKRAGELAVFIRFKGCNLNCSYCDTRWANSESSPSKPMSLDELVKYVLSSKVKNVTLTGGEPLLQQDIYPLIEKFMRSGCRVEIETNGSISVAQLAEKPCRPDFTFDYKLPSSGMESAMLTDNYRYLNENDVVKFVVGSISDLERAADIIKTYSLAERCKVYLSPVFGKIEPAEIVAFMTEHKMNDVRLQLQLHKFIWDPYMKGV